MSKVFSRKILILFLLIVFVSKSYSQTLLPSFHPTVSLPGIPIIEYLPDENDPLSTPSKKYLKKLPLEINLNLQNQTPNPNGSAFNFIFNNGIDSIARETFLEAGRIWSEYIFSPIPINVNVNFTSLAANVLGSAYSTSYYRYPLYLDSTYYYPVSLFKRQIEDYDFISPIDIQVNFNSGFSNWNLGTGAPSSNQYDLLTVVLHELGHGLGFNGFLASKIINDGSGNNTRVGYWLNNINIYSIFDSYLYHSQLNNRVINNSIFPNNSTQLNNVITDGSLHLINSKILNVSNSPAILYAPSTYSAGSSIYHLDETTYPVNNENTLMTPFVAAGQASRSIGPIVKAYMSSLGYTTPILGSPPHQTNYYPENDSIEIVAKAYYPYYDSNFQLGPASLYYTIGLTTNPQMSITRNFNTNNYSFKIPVPLVNTDTTIYYLTEMSVYEQTLNNGNQLNYYYSPQKTKTNNLYYTRFRILVDTLNPSILPVDIIDTLKFDTLNRLILFPNFQIKDSSGIEEVKLYFQFRNNNLDSIIFNPTPGQTLFSFSFDNIYFEDEDNFQYFIIAKEKYYKKKVKRYPESGFANLILRNAVNKDFLIDENLINKNIQINTKGSINLSAPIEGDSEVELKGKVIHLEPGTKIDSSSGSTLRVKPQ